MQILNLILSFVFHLFTCFVMLYCTDTAKLWKKEEISLQMPTIKNLNNDENTLKVSIYKVDEYVKKIINPAHHYFILKNEINKSQENEGYANEISFFVLQLFSCGIIVYFGKSVFQNLHIILIGLTVIILCILGYLIIKKLYSNSRLKISDFEYDLDSLKSRFQHSDYNVDDEADFNNYVIFKHYNYLLSIEDSIRFRYSIKKIMITTTAIIYFLFFMQIPN